MRDDKLWIWFSRYIRLRDSDENGFAKCFTCGRVMYWNKFDAGHGLGRQHLGIKYHEKNNHAQCGNCNLDGGRQDVYKEKVNKLYGENTWMNLELMKRKPVKWSGFEIEALTEHYKKEVHSLLKQKNLSLK
jgi:hypothetical protein